MKSLLGLTIVSLGLALTACEDPAANKVRAITSGAGTTASEPANAPRQAKGEALVVNPENSKVSFVGSKVTGKHDGGFNRFAGTIDLVDRKPEDSRVWVEIETASVYTDTDGLTKHLQTGDFFETEKFPKASFVSTAIVPGAENGGDNYTVTGDLELRGEKRSVTFPAAIKVSPENVLVNAEFVINRKDFGIVYAGKADDLIRDNVVIKLDLSAPRKN